MAVTYIRNELTLQQNNHAISFYHLSQKTGQPFFLYDLNGISQRYHHFKKYVPTANVYFSMKCNNCPSVLQTLLKEGAGLDIVSGGELKRGLEVGGKVECMVFSGVGKTKEELELAIQSSIFQINVESLQELERIGQISQSLGQTVRVAFRINPNVTLDTHEFIQTGTSDHKFGMEEKFLPDFLEIIKKYSKYLQFQGLAMHIGSQGLSVKPILKASQIVKSVYERLKREGHPLTTIDIGGGVGIDYQNQNPDSDLKTIEFYGKELQNIFKNFPDQVLCEPGRILVGRYGWLAGEVQYIKKTSRTQFAILNTGIHHLIRPALYQSYHHVWPAKKSNQKEQLYTLAGPICESTDVLARDRWLPTLQQGDWLIFCDAGAYCAVMSQNYNMKESALELPYANGSMHSSL